ncbi:hypothetical protein HMPREF9946_01255 [Acetobacteraceae bacterium AT-5844]|nr:hypothetical protein HMPREF9946_01255 [Acetobacteraceae bacterium AT-5844]
MAGLFVGAHGRPDASLLEDGLHLSEKGYEILQQALSPFLAVD